MKFLNKEGVTYLYKKVNENVASQVKSVTTAVEGKQDTLVSGTNIKTVNGESLLGSGDIAIDLTLYKVVETLPTEGIDESKIYLVKSSESGTSDIYTEYMYVSSAWEKIGEYKSDVDLTAYAKTEDVTTQLATKADKSDTYTKEEVDSKVTASGTFSEADATKLAGIEAKAQVNVIETVKVNGTALTVSDKTVDIEITYDDATTKASGLMSATDKTKLDAVAEAATADEALTNAEIDEAIAAASATTA